MAKVFERDANATAEALLSPPLHPKLSTVAKWGGADVPGERQQGCHRPASNFIRQRAFGSIRDNCGCRCRNVFLNTALLKYPTNHVHQEMFRRRSAAVPA